MHRSERRSQTSRTIRETEAEAVAFVVSHAIGLDGAEISTSYIQLWNGDKQTLTESLRFIQGISDPDHNLSWRLARKCDRKLFSRIFFCPAHQLPRM